MYHLSKVSLQQIMSDMFRIKPFRNLLLPLSLKNPVTRRRVSSVATFVVIVLLPLITIIIWQLYKGSFEIYTKTPLRALAKVSIFAGTIWFSLTFILSTRWGFIEKVFGGLDKVYRVHEILGRLTVIASFVHLVALILHKLSLDSSIIALLIPGLDWGYTWGILSFVVMLILVVMTVWIMPKYHIWFNLHRIMGIALILDVMHFLLIPTTYVNQFPGLKVWMLFWTGLGILAYFYKLIFYDRFAPQCKADIEMVYTRNNVVDIKLNTKGQFMFNPGQYVFVKFTKTENKLSTEMHPFSISNYSEEGYVRLAMKKLGDFSGKLEGLKEGDQCKIYGPYGEFGEPYLNANSNAGQDMIWIAGGIGITPFLSMLDHYKTNADAPLSNKHIQLFYGSQKQTDYINKSKLDKFATENKNLNVFYQCDELGDPFLNAEKIAEVVGGEKELKSRLIFLCGPIPMMNALIDQFIKKGVKPENIISEAFDFV